MFHNDQTHDDGTQPISSVIRRVVCIRCEQSGGSFSRQGTLLAAVYVALLEAWQH